MNKKLTSIASEVKSSNKVPKLDMTSVMLADFVDFQTSPRPRLFNTANGVALIVSTFHSLNCHLYLIIAYFLFVEQLGARKRKTLKCRYIVKYLSTIYRKL